MNDGTQSPNAEYAGQCDPHLESRLSPIPHDYEVVGDEDGSLADGGSYDVLKCRRCGRVAYSPIAD